MSIPGLIEQQVAARPDAIAVHTPGHPGDDVSLTYRELSRAANRLARHLVARGIGRGDRVAASLRPGPLLVTALLAVLRTGAAYVALDPADPLAHRRFVVRDSAARTVLAEAADASDYAGLPAVLLTPHAAALESGEQLHLVSPCSGDDPAYVCYTSGSGSGSGGGPAVGVVVPRRALDELLRPGAAFRPGRDDVVAQTASPASAASVFEIWATLGAGARLTVLSSDVVAGPERLRRALVDHGVTAALLTAARFRRVVRDRPDAFGSLRTLLVGGGVCDPHQVRRVLRAGPPRRLLQVYGVAETAAFALCHAVTGAAADLDGAIPLGRPVGATAAVVVGAHGLPAEPGTVGELLLGGPALADGPLGRPEPGARRFVEDRFTGVGGRLLRTGDKVLLRTDGALEYAGRVDDHVTLHGLRADLREVESLLTAHPGVCEAVVTVHTDADGERRLVGHVVPVLAGRGEEDDERVPTGVHAGAGGADADGTAPSGTAPGGTASGGTAPGGTAPGGAVSAGVTTAGVTTAGVASAGAGSAGTVSAGALPAARPVAAGPVVSDRTVPLDTALRGYLHQRLPDGLVPSALVLHRELPLNTEGLVDRAALPAPGPAPAMTPGTPPGTPLQEIVRDLFAEVLGLPRRLIDADCDFFAVGGHASAAARLLERVRETLGAGPADPAALRAAPTPAALAALVGEIPAAVIGPGTPQSASCTSGTDSVVLAFRLRGPLDVRVLDEALTVLGRRHGVLRNSRTGNAGTRLRSLAPDDHLLELALPAADVDLWSQLPLAADLASVHRELAAGGAPSPDRELVRYAPRSPYGDRAPTGLPGSGPRRFDTAPGRLDLDLDEALHARLTRFAAAHGATVFMVVHAALTAVLHQLGKAGEITVAAPVPARDNATLRGAVGAYGRVLALTVDASDDPAFGELVRRARERDLTAYRSAQAPLAGAGGVALTVLQDATAGQFASGPLTVQPEGAGLALPATDVGFTLTERQSRAGAPAGISLTTTYRRETVGETVAATLTDRLVALLAAALDRPDAVLSALVPAGRPAVREGVWEAGRHELPATTVAELFAERVRSAPRAVALSGAMGVGGADGAAGEDGVSREGGAPAVSVMDYAELDFRSDLLAHALVAHGAGAGATVLTALSSPTGFAVAALAIAKTGAACVPVDPAQKLPASVRPVAVLLDETADLLLEQTPGAARLVRDEAADLLPADGKWPLEEGDRTRPLSAGDPVLWALGAAGAAGWGGATVVGSGPVVAATLAEPVDAAWLVRGYPDADATIGLLGALVRGVQVHIPDRSLRHAVPQELLRWLRERDARMLLGGSDEVLVALVALAGEERLPLLTSGGWAEGHLVVEHLATGAARPAPGYRAYVLDARLRPVAPGTVGALYVAGAGVALGYAGAPAATGERFLPDPFAGAGATARMWRTGRAARLDADGTLTVLEGPAPDDPFAGAPATFVVVGDDSGRRALWPASAPVPAGWSQVRAESRYEWCPDHLDELP
ncbi:AMP-binding protein [Streptomyces sp. A1277]|uniref:AMP-binding protein n=1 Tax=Streptomyces sp. A1277 TaxID=2563103 RepID=UPI0014460EE9|nr:AMP-binding protein [Streptomyces sp. A1277]